MYLNDVFTVTVNLAGLPGIAVPAGLTEDGLPLGLQLIGKAFDEATVLRAGRAIEQAAEFHGTNPPTGGGRHERTPAPRLIKGQTGDWEIVIGMEVHAQVLSKSKLFSGASTEFGAEPNSQVSFVDAGMPGMLPVINEQMRRAGGAHRPGPEGARSICTSIFDRKNYFYPDLPPGLSDQPVQEPHRGRGRSHHRPQGRRKPSAWASSGCIWSRMPAKACTTSIPTIPMSISTASGIALMEIVTRPDMRSSARKRRRSCANCAPSCAIWAPATAIWTKAPCAPTSMSRSAGAAMRFRGRRFKHLGTRCEIKNVNSMRFIAQAVEYEARRQVEIIEGGGTIRQETRLFDSQPGRDALHALQGRGA